MQIVIDIPEREYKVICENNYVAVCACPNLLSNAIKKGTVLPEHGRLFYADRYVDGRYTHIAPIDNAPTILEATGVEE